MVNKPDSRMYRSRTSSTRSRRGIVMVLTLLSMILLVGMVIFVINIGRQTSRRTSLQNAADASVIAGSGWVARSLNTVAMNNVNMTRTLAMINVVDAMPDSTMFTITEHTSELEAVQSTLSRGVKDSKNFSNISPP